MAPPDVPAPRDEPAPGERLLLGSMRALLVVAGVLVFLAGVQLFVFPLRTDRWFAWTVDPPMTAVFLGAAYWSSLAFEWAAARRRRWCDARISVPTVFVFTTLTLVATLLHVDRFHFGPEHQFGTRVVTWAWLVVYAVVPVLMVVLVVVQARVPGVDRPRTHALPSWVRGVIAAEAVLLLAVGTGLFVVPGRVGSWWPWMLTPLTARAVGAWCIGLGVAAAHAWYEDDVHRLRPAAWAFLVFAVLQAVALARHGEALDPGRASTWIYVAFLASAALIGVVVLVGASRADRDDARIVDLRPPAGSDGAVDAPPGRPLPRR